MFLNVSIWHKHDFLKITLKKEYKPSYHFNIHISYRKNTYLTEFVYCFNILYSPSLWQISNLYTIINVIFRLA